MRDCSDSVATPATLLPNKATISRFAALATPAAFLRDDLAAAINRCCDARGDSDANRQGLLDECSRLPPHQQTDLRVHFVQEVVRWMQHPLKSRR